MKYDVFRNADTNAKILTLNISKTPNYNLGITYSDLHDAFIAIHLCEVCIVYQDFW